MNVHDDALLDSVAVYALGAASPAEARETEAHIAGCPICQAELRELRTASAALALSAEASEADIGGARCAQLKSRVMAAVRADAAVPTIASQPASTVVPFAPRRRSVPTSVAYLAAAAAIALAFYSSFDAASMHSQAAKDREQIALLQARADMNERSAGEARAQLALAQSRVADLVAPNAKMFPLAGGVVARANNRIVIAVQHLPAPPKGKVYQAWTLKRGAKTMTPSITFVPDPSGLALVELPDAAANLAAVAVSIEPEGGSLAPTSKPTFVRTLS